MKFYEIALTITTYRGLNHDHFDCFLFCEANGKHESKKLDINAANKLMWELKAKGYETTTLTSYNPYTPRVYTRNIIWMKFE